MLTPARRRLVRSIFLSSIACLAGLALWYEHAGAQASAAVVNSTADNGTGGCMALGTGDGCTLREAITQANTQAGDDLIRV